MAPVTTVDLSIATGAQIPIEQRPPVEACVVRGALFPLEEGRPQTRVLLTPEGIAESEGGVYNPSFDVTPAELISAIVTEKGVAVRRADGTFDLSSVV